MAQEYEGWDWFALHLSDGRDLMVYYLRRKDGTVEKESSGTLVERDGALHHLRLDEIETTVLSYWKSSKSAGRYPAAWRIKVAGAAIDVTVNPLVAGQELITTASTAITYWEGAVAGKGVSQGKEVAVEGVCGAHRLRRNTGWDILISRGKFPEACFVPCCFRYPAACCGRFIDGFQPPEPPL